MSTKINDLYYNLNASTKTAEVTYEVLHRCSNYSTLTSVDIPSRVRDANGATYSVTSIGEDAFSYCSALTRVTIPSSVSSIGKSAFQYCRALTSVTIPSSVSSIGEEAFSWCSKLTSVTIPNAVKTIEKSAFSHCSALTSLTIPNKVSSIGESAFYDCSGLTSVTIPNSVSSIGVSAFSCSALTSVTIPDSVSSIRVSAFSGCRELTSLTIPNSVSSIGKAAFSYCSALKSLTCKAPTPPSVSSDTFNTFDGILDIPVYVPCDSVSAYKKASGWSRFTNIQAIAGSCNSAVKNASIANAKVYTQGKEIIVAFENNQAANVQIYDLGGKMVYSSANGDVNFDAPQSGVYVVKIGNQSTKVIVK